MAGGETGVIIVKRVVLGDGQGQEVPVSRRDRGRVIDRGDARLNRVRRVEHGVVDRGPVLGELDRLHLIDRQVGVGGAVHRISPADAVGVGVQRHRLSGRGAVRGHGPNEAAVQECRVGAEYLGRVV